MKLLSIDDEKTNLLLVELMAQGLGFEVSSFLWPTEAIAEADDGRFDMILVDYMMPEMNGIELIEAIRSKQPDIPIIMITGTADDQSLKLRALEAGATEFINKPIDVAEFRARLSNLATLRRAQILLKDRALLLEKEVAEATQNIVEREYETLGVLGRAAEYRDPETAAHISRVAHYSRMIAAANGEPDDVLETLYYSAPLHDIGKIGISDTILFKPGKLTAEEFEEIKKHTTIGNDIIRDSASSFLRAGSVVSLHHHERFDGGGYPRGIAGEEIHLYGRIVAIADVFDALTSLRPYKEPWPIERALDHIDQQSSRHFDPELARHFLSSETRVREVFHMFADKS